MSIAYQIVLYVIEPYQIKFLNVMGGQICVRYKPFVIILPMTAVMAPRIRCQLMSDAYRDGLRYEVYAYEVKMMTGLTRTRLFLIIPIQVLLGSIYVDRYPSSIMEFCADFEINGREDHAFTNALYAVGLDVGNIRFLFNRAAFFDLIMSILVRFLDASTANMITTMVSEVDGDVERLSLTDFFRPFRFRMARNGRDVICYVRRFRTGSELAACDYYEDAFSDMGLKERSAIFIEV